MTALRFEVGCAKCGSEVRLGGGSRGAESRPVCTDVRRQVVCTACRAEFVVAAVMLPINRQDPKRDLAPEEIRVAREQYGTLRAAAFALGIDERRAYRILAKAKAT